VRARREDAEDAAIYRDITSGELAPGAAVPSQAEVAARFGVSSGTARLAL
jgi:DNA-binding GntR family transcriptional regulator